MVNDPQFDEANKAAKTILQNYRGKIVPIAKPTRAGATTSLIKNACELGQKTVIVSPTLQILDETVNNALKLVNGKTPVYRKIEANKQLCKKLIMKNEKNPSLKNLPFLRRPSCEKCEFNNPDCPLQAILQCDYDVLGITYQKLQVLSFSESQTSQDLFAKVKSPDNLILDEFTTGIIASFPTIEINEPRTYLLKEFTQFESKEIPVDTTTELDLEFWSSIQYFARVCELVSQNLHDGESKVFVNPIKKLISSEHLTQMSKHFGAYWKKVEDFTAQGKDTETLQKLIRLFTVETLEMSRKNGKVTVKTLKKPSDTDMKIASTDYLRSIILSFLSDKTLVALVDASLPRFDIGRALGIPKDKLKTYTWDDFLNTNKTQLIICDTRRITKDDFFRKNSYFQPQIKETINVLSKFLGSNRIVIATQSRKMASAVFAWQKLGEIPSGILVTWYRSEISKGTAIDPNRHFLILMGGSYIPKKSFKAEAPELFVTCKLSDEHANFVNMIGRVKDPKGQLKSVVFALGMTAEEVKTWVKDSLSSPYTDHFYVTTPYIAQFPMTGAKPEDFKIAAEMFLQKDINSCNVYSIEEAIPYLAMIIRKVRENKQLLFWEITPNSTKTTRELVCTHKELLKSYGIDEQKHNLIDIGSPMKPFDYEAYQKKAIEDHERQLQIESQQVCEHEEEDEHTIFYESLTKNPNHPKMCEQCLRGKNVADIELAYNTYLVGTRFICNDCLQQLKDDTYYLGYVWKEKAQKTIA
jgi:hypothetical protein